MSGIYSSSNSHQPLSYIDGGKKFETFSNSCFSKTLAYIFKTKWPTDRLITRLQHMQSLFNLVPVFKNYTSQPFGNRAHQIQPHLQRDHMLAFEDFLFQFFNIFGVFGFNIILILVYWPSFGPKCRDFEARLNTVFALICIFCTSFFTFIAFSLS